MATTTATIAASGVRMDTYRFLKLSRIVLLSLVALLLLAMIIGAQVHRDAMQTIGKDAAPSIIAAQHIKAALADMDADEANILLAPPNTANSNTSGVTRRRDEAEEGILNASGNVTYFAERAPIKTLQLTMGYYNRLAQQAEDFHDANSPMDVRSYQVMADLMDEKLLPAADELDRANDSELQRTYGHQATDSSVTTAFVVIVGLITLAALIAMQLFLSRRTRRTLNLPLLIATIATACLFLYGLSALLTEQRRLKVAKEDSFESVHALWQARAIAYQANAEESRYLLDPKAAGDHQRAFFRETDKLAKLPAGMSLNLVLAKLNRGQKVEGFSGYLADELNNITFAGEEEAATKTLIAFENYLAVDAKLRRLENSGPEHHQDAINLCVGTGVDESDGAFQSFDDALAETLRINQQEFDKSVEEGLSSVGELKGHFSVAEILPTLEFRAFVLSALIAILVALGLAPRIKEYE